MLCIDFCWFLSYGSLKYINIAALDPIIIIINSIKFKSMESLTGEKRRNLELAKNMVIMTHNEQTCFCPFSNLWWTHQFPIIYTETKYYFCLNKIWLILIKMFIWKKSRPDKRRQWFWPFLSAGVSTTVLSLRTCKGLSIEVKIHPGKVHLL